MSLRCAERECGIWESPDIAYWHRNGHRMRLCPIAWGEYPWTQLNEHGSADIRIFRNGPNGGIAARVKVTDQPRKIPSPRGIGPLISTAASTSRAPTNGRATTRVAGNNRKHAHGRPTRFEPENHLEHFGHAQFYTLGKISLRPSPHPRDGATEKWKLVVKRDILSIT